jgi:tRNA-dihydrouridine synthase 1
MKPTTESNDTSPEPPKKKRKKSYKTKKDESEKKRAKKEKKQKKEERRRNAPPSSLPPHQYILAPMVGASELAFRLLCRKYGVQLCYTPMMSSTEFARNEQYRKSEFQTIPEDRPLVCHFSANDPTEFAQAAKYCEPYCDAIDLNLGCPQRTAYVGHFGSYLLDEKDRELVLSIVRAGVSAVSIPIFVKIRLLDELNDTIKLCRQLKEAGASLIAIHARYRARFERKGPGARDGPALLDQVAAIKKAVPGIPIISNGNIITFKDCVENLELTAADGVMSAEGILDNPALYRPRLGSRDDSDKTVVIADPSPLDFVSNGNLVTEKERKLRKKLRKIHKIERIVSSSGEAGINDEQHSKLAKKAKIEKQLQDLEASANATCCNHGDSQPRTQTVTLGELYDSADDKLADEYLALVRKYPVKIRSVVFHIRRMLKDTLNRYQLMEECVACETVEQVQAVVDRCRKYQENPETFLFDREKAARQKEALEKKRREEGKRKAFEARMIRKAKREGKSDLEFYLRIGAEVPSRSFIRKLKALPREKQLELWKRDHSQHCLAYHVDPGGCKRDRSCAFLHSDAKGTNTFVESDEVAG